MPLDVCSRAIAFERWWLRAQASSVLPVEAHDRTVGELVLTDDTPHVQDHNALVLHPGHGLSAVRVATLLDDLLGSRGYTHRRLYVDDPEEADELRPGLADHGLQEDHTVVMRWEGTSQPTARDGVAIRRADGVEVQRWVRTILTEHHDRAEVVDDLAELARRQHRLGVTFLVAEVAGELAGGIRIFPGDHVAQVEELDVRARFRGRGVGGALLRAALQLVTDRDLVFLTSDPDGWPTGWYSRLGLRVVGRSSGFARAECGTTSYGR